MAGNISWISVEDQAPPTLSMYQDRLQVHAGLPGKTEVKTQKEGRTMVEDRTNRAEALKGMIWGDCGLWRAGFQLSGVNESDEQNWK